MTIRQQGGVFGRNPTFNDLTVDGSVTVPSDSITGDAINGGTATPAVSAPTSYVRFPEYFATDYINNSNEDVVTKEMAIQTTDVWEIELSSANVIKGFYRLVVHRDNGGGISATTKITDFESTGGTTISVTDNTNGTYTINVANGAANNKAYSGRLIGYSLSSII
jgi:hypothetical protein